MGELLKDAIEDLKKLTSEEAKFCYLAGLGSTILTLLSKVADIPIEEIERARDSNVKLAEEELKQAKLEEIEKHPLFGILGGKKSAEEKDSAEEKEEDSPPGRTTD